MSLNYLFATVPRASEWSFALTISGIPDILSDGKGDWSSLYPERTHRPGVLTTRDFELAFRSDPQKPLVVSSGSGPIFKLKDDGTDYIHELFAVDNEGASTAVVQTVGAGASDITLYVQDNSLFTVGQYVYMGLETCKITYLGSPDEVEVDRAQLDTLRRTFLVTNQSGVKLSSVPRAMRGRFVELWMAPVESLSRDVDVSEAAPIWAGVISEIEEEGELISVQTDSLDRILTAAWPVVLPTGSLFQGQGTIQLNSDMWRISLRWLDQSGSAPGNNYVDLNLGTFNTSGTFSVATPVSGRVSIAYLAKVYQDTINNFFATTSLAPFRNGGVQVFANSMSITVKYDTGVARVLASWVPANVNAATTISSIDITRVLGASNRSPFNGTIVRGMTDQALGLFHDTLQVIQAEDTSIPVVMDNINYPFATAYRRGASDFGFVRIQDGEKWELVQFTGVTIDSSDPKRCTLNNCVRHIGGSSPCEWGVGEDGTASAATVTQLLCMSQDSLTLDEVVGTLLLSTEDAGQQGAYDTLYGKGMGLNIPARFVDYDRLALLQSSQNLIGVSKFWVDEKGKGASSLEEYLKMMGIYLITRRFQRGGQWYFGISADTLDAPVVTSTYDTLTDDDRERNTKAILKRNDRLIINSVSTRPFSKRWGTKDTDGEPITIFDQWSIEEHGASKTLEIKPTALYVIWDDTITGERYIGREAQLAWLEVVGIRWFGAYGRGHCTLDLECVPPTGWRFSMGDKILVTLSGVRNPQGGAGLVATPAKVMELDQGYGAKAKIKLRLRIGYENFAELAPNAKVTSIASTTLTLSANEFSRAIWPTPGTGNFGAVDADWFDPSIYKGNIRCMIWTEGKWATTKQTFKVTSRLSANVLTIDTNLTATSVATNLGSGENTLISFDTFDSSDTTRQKAYAHIADNGLPPVIGSSKSKDWR